MSQLHTIILDTDPGIDDAMALLLALASPEIALIGVTTVFGNSHVAATTRNALNLLHFAGRADIPVAMGADQPLVLPRGRTGEHVHGPDAMGNIGWDAVHNPNQRPLAIHAAQFIAETIMQRPGQVTIVAVGPLTNLALALQLEPRIAEHVRAVVVMGGAFLVPGNVSPLAESNIYRDPHAAAKVFAAGWPLTVAGLDVTTAVRMDNAYFAALKESRSRFAEFICRIVPFYQAFHREVRGYRDGAINPHDVCAIAYVLEPALFAGEQWRVMVLTDGPARGATIPDRADRHWSTPKVHCLTRVDSARLLAAFHERISRAI